jgi:hypothetical protein
LRSSRPRSSPRERLRHSDVETISHEFAHSWPPAATSTSALRTSTTSAGSPTSTSGSTVPNRSISTNRANRGCRGRAPGDRRDVLAGRPGPPRGRLRRRLLRLSLVARLRRRSLESFRGGGDRQPGRGYGPPARSWNRERPGTRRHWWRRSWAGHQRSRRSWAGRGSGPLRLTPAREARPRHDTLTTCDTLALPRSCYNAHEARTSQAECRGFESRLPLHYLGSRSADF